MSITLLDLAYMANQVYGENSQRSGNGTFPFYSPGQHYWTDELEDFFAGTYVIGNVVVLSIKGSEEIYDFLVTDVAILFNKLKESWIFADGAYQGVSALYQKQEIIVTGHSLGGGLAQMLAAKYKILGAAFNPPGMGKILEKNDLSLERSVGACGFFNVRLEELVSGFKNDHYGEMLQLESPPIFMKGPCFKVSDLSDELIPEYFKNHAMSRVIASLHQKHGDVILKK